MTPPLLRSAVEADLPDIRRLILGLADYEKLRHKAVATEADLCSLMFGPRALAHAILAQREPATRPVGIAIYYFTISTFAGRPGLFLEDIFVEPAHRGAGIGLALFRRLARIAVAENCVSVDWRVLDWNQPAIDFYERLGATRMTEWHVRQLQGDALAALAEGSSHG